MERKIYCYNTALSCMGKEKYEKALQNIKELTGDNSIVCCQEVNHKFAEIVRRDGYKTHGSHRYDGTSFKKLSNEACTIITNKKEKSFIDNTIVVKASDCGKNEILRQLLIYRQALNRTITSISIKGENETTISLFNIHLDPFNEIFQQYHLDKLYSEVKKAVNLYYQDVIITGKFNMPLTNKLMSKFIEDLQSEGINLVTIEGYTNKKTKEMTSPFFASNNVEIKDYGVLDGNYSKKDGVSYIKI